jgi:hypothetical protein
MALSGLFPLIGRRNAANFIGQWVPTIPIVGLDSKFATLHGSAR